MCIVGSLDDKKFESSTWEAFPSQQDHSREIDIERPGFGHSVEGVDIFREGVGTGDFGLESLHGIVTASDICLLNRSEASPREPFALVAFIEEAPIEADDAEVIDTIGEYPASFFANGGEFEIEYGVINRIHSKKIVFYFISGAGGHIFAEGHCFFCVGANAALSSRYPPSDPKQSGHDEKTDQECDDKDDDCGLSECINISHNKKRTWKRQ